MKKKFLSMILISFLMLSLFEVLHVSANEKIYTGKCGDNVYYTFTVENYTESNVGTLVISGTGEMWDFDVDFPSPFSIGFDEYYIGSIIVEYGVTTIGDEAFYSVYASSIKIPYGVTSIGNASFYGCINLTKIQIPDSVTNIGYSAFKNCNNLTDITISNSLTNLGGYAFEDTGYYNTEENWEDGLLYLCDEYLIGIKDSVTEFVVKDGVSLISSTFANKDNIISVTLPDSILHIPSFAFDQCGSLRKINIPGKVEIIDAYAFRGCTALEEIVIPDSVTEIGNCAFDGCKALKEIVIPDTVTAIPYSAFSKCSDLSKVTFGNSLKSIEMNAFYDCTALSEITIPESVNLVGGYAFNNTGYYNNRNNWDGNFLYIDNCLVAADRNISGSHAIKDGTRLIAEEAVGKCNKLTSITIPGSLTRIESKAFWYCEALKDVIINEGVESIGMLAFANCTALQKITIPESVKKIENVICRACDSLSNVYYSGSENDWSKIEIGTKNDCLFNANITYDYGVTLYECGNSVTGRLKNGTLTVSGEGAMWDENSAPHNYLPFVGNTEIATLIIEDGVTTIEGFNGCSSLTRVVIPESVTAIGENAFADCDNLSAVYYEGSESAWNSIVISSCNEVLKNAVIYYGKIIDTTGVELNEGEIILNEGENMALIATVKPSDATNQQVVWKSSDETIAIVDENGVITAIGKGQATITVTTANGGYSAECVVTVERRVTGIELDKKEVLLKTGESIMIEAKVTPSDATNTKVVWTTSDESVATVVDGVITAISEGSVTVVAATVDGNYSAQCMVNVFEPKYDYKVINLKGEVKNEAFYAEAEITKNSDRSSKDMIVIAVYDDLYMIDMVYMKANLEQGQTVSFGGLLNGKDGAKLKAFVWDSMDSMNSLSNVVEK